MPNLTLKNISDELYDRLKTAANENHRSLNSELIACLENTLMPVKWTPEQHLASARALRKRVNTKKLSVKEFQDLKNQGRT